MDYDIFDSEVGLDSWLRRDGSQLGSPMLGESSDVTTTNPIATAINTTQINPGEFASQIGYSKKSFTDTSAGYLMGLDTDGIYKWIIGNSTNSVDWAVTTAATLTVKGTITASAGVIGGFTIGATTLSATNLILTSGAANTANIAVGTGSNVAGLNSVSAASDIAFWAGDTFANRATAPFRVTADGQVTAKNVTVTSGGTVVGFTKLGSSTTPVTISNTTETTLASISIPANTLSTANLIRLKIYFYQFSMNNNSSYTFRLKYGTTTICSAAGAVPNTGVIVNMRGVAEFWVLAAGTTNSQVGTMDVFLTENNVATSFTTSTSNYFRSEAEGTAAEDSTGALNLVVTGQYGGLGGASSMTMLCYACEVVR